VKKDIERLGQQFVNAAIHEAGFALAMGGPETELPYAVKVSWRRFIAAIRARHKTKGGER
jgi:predicted secreted Zn-dependent protease